MKKIYLLFYILFIVGTSFGQWQRVAQLPSSDISALTYQNRTIYAGGIHKVYWSTDEGISWNASAVIPGIPAVDDIAIFHDEWFVSSFSNGIYKSVDKGASWQNISGGLRYVNEFTIWNGSLYAATGESGIYKLSSNRSQWERFSNGFYWASSSAIGGNSQCMVAAGGGNGAIFRYSSESAVWTEYFVRGQSAAGLDITDIINVNDTLYAATTFGVYYSTNGMNWMNTGTIRNGQNTVLANVKQAVFAIVNFGVNVVDVFLKPKDNQQLPWPLTERLFDDFVYKMNVTPKYIWQARMTGLYYRKLSDYNVDPPVQEVQQLAVGNIYPNPSKQKVSIRIDVPAATSFAGYVSNVLGQKVEAITYHLAEGQNVIVLDKPLQAGVYFFNMRINGQRYTRKFLITK